jgi:hypothetical protein
LSSKEIYKLKLKEIKAKEAAEKALEEAERAKREAEEATIREEKERLLADQARKLERQGTSQKKGKKNPFASFSLKKEIDPLTGADPSNKDEGASVHSSEKSRTPTGADGIINAADIDYVFAQFKNSHVLDGQANWNDLNEAVYFDLSADINGDLSVDDRDICQLVTGILGTSIGDVNLDGNRNAADFAIAQSYRGGVDRAGGWANGDVDGDGADDLLVGSERGQEGVGRAWLLYGLY